MAFNIWGNVDNVAYAVPMAKLTPTFPQSQGYTLAWNIIAGAMDYAPLSFDFLTGDATLEVGNFGVANGYAYEVNGIQVVSARKTGWGIPTGTSTRTTFDTTTVTLPQLAECMKALIEDLRTHGLIGS